MLYYIIILISILAYVLSDLLFASQIRKFGSMKVNIFRSFILAVFVMPLIFFADLSKINFNILFLSFLFGFSGLIYFLSSLESYKYLPARIVTSIISLESLVVMILSYCFYNEKFTYIGYLGAFILIVSTILITLIKNEFSHLDKKWFYGIILSIIGLFGGAFWGFGFAYIARETDIFLAGFLSHFTVFLIIFPLTFFIKGFYAKSLENLFIIKKISFSTFVYAIATLLYFYSTLIGKISISILFLSLIPIFVAIIGNFYLKEKLFLSQWILIFISFLGLILINI